MFKQLLLATTLVAASVPTAFAMSDADCAALATRSDVYAAGKLSAPYTQAAVKAGQKIPADGTIDLATFMAACKADAFKTAAVVAEQGKTAAMTPVQGAPFPGANSFTEAQAVDRIEKAGFTAVSGLKKDDQGIWRASAMQGGKSMSVALDFKGNVVAK